MKKNQFAHLKKKKNWIGFVINSELGKLYIAEDRTKPICVKEIIQKLPYTTARKIETFWGKIFSTKLVKGNLVQLRTRNLYKPIKQQSLLDFQINMSSCSASLEELLVSKINFEKLNVLKLFYYIVSDIFVTSDTSSTGLATFLVHQKKKFMS